MTTSAPELGYAEAARRGEGSNPELALELRKHLVDTGSAEELVKLLASFIEKEHSLDPSHTFEERGVAVSSANAPKGRFDAQLPELVKGRDGALGAEQLAAENISLAKRIEEMEAELANGVQTLSERGIVELATIRLTNVCCQNIPDMDPGSSGAGASDPYVVVSVVADETNEWRSFTPTCANVEAACAWEEVPDINIPAKPSGSYEVTLSMWDDDKTNPDDCMGKATVVLSGRSGKVSAHPLLLGGRAVKSTDISDSSQVETAAQMSFDWEIIRAGFGEPPPTTPSSAPVNQDGL